MDTVTKIKKLTITLATISILSMTTAAAHANAVKQSILETAIEVCELAAQNKYGEKSVKSISPKVRWSKGLNGADVRMKIKKKARSPKQFSCIVDLDGSTTFYSL